MMRFLNSLLVFSLFFLCPLDTSGKMYKWVDETGQIHWSDKPPNSEATAKDIKEYKSVEDNAKDKKPVEDESGNLDFSNVTVSNIKTKVVSKKTNRRSKYIPGSGASSSAGSSDPNVWISIKADVGSVEGYGGDVRITLQAVDREGFELKTVFLRGDIPPGETVVLSERTSIRRKLLKQIHKWEIRRIYTQRMRR